MNRPDPPRGGEHTWTGTSSTAPSPTGGRRAPLQLGRDHTGTLVVGNLIHVVGGRAYVAGGGPVMGGSVQSAVHEAFMPAS